MRQSDNDESPTRRNGTHESAGLEHLFKAETGGLANRHCFPIVVHVPSGIMLGHTVCVVCTEARLCASGVRVPPSPAARLARPGLAQRPPHITEIWFNMVSARTHCPQCNQRHVLQLDEVFYSPNVDFFRCEDCRYMWHVDKGKDGPASRTLFGDSNTSVGQNAPKRVGGKSA